MWKIRIWGWYRNSIIRVGYGLHSVGQKQDCKQRCIYFNGFLIENRHFSVPKCTVGIFWELLGHFGKRKIFPTNNCHAYRFVSCFFDGLWSCKFQSKDGNIFYGIIWLKFLQYSAQYLWVIWLLNLIPRKTFVWRIVRALEYLRSIFFFFREMVVDFYGS